MAGRLEGWLAGLGLGRYAEAFAAQAIDLDVLADLTESDLERLGLPLGDRKRLLKAIAAGLPAAPATSAPASADEGERRQVTILFCDLVGWTGLSTRLDPEDLREVLAAYHDACNATIARYGGFVAKLLGDGVLVYFGYPQAHEDDPERAVRAALEIVGLVPGLRPELGLAVRVGIATGLAVVGDIIGEGAAEQRAAIGETPNLAARLQGLAAPGEIVVSPATRRLAGGVFDYAELGAQTLKGIAQPVRPWRVLGERRTESRFEAAHAERLTSFVGRDQEVGLLAERWARAKEGDGQVVLLSGEAGIGKSRVTEALRERIADEAHTRLRYQCSPHRTHSALYPVIAQLEYAAGLAAGDAPQAKLDKLEALLAAGADQPAGVAPLVAELLGIPAGNRYPVVELTPLARKQKLLDALVDQLAGLARRAPVLMILEDAHWIDPTTDELFTLTVERVRRLPLLLIVTCRPEYAAPWKGRDHVTTLSLNRLGRRHGAAIVAELVGRAALPAEVLERIVARADGVPLFLEELTKAIVEAGGIDAGTLAQAASPEAIPSTLRDSLLARLDRLGAAKEVAQIGAAIGREFPFALLAGVCRMPAQALTGALDQLESAGLVFASGRPPEALYTFKHALVQDAAYGTLLRARRQNLHGAIAQAIERDFPQRAEAEPEVLAHHYDEAGFAEKAIPYWLRAGERSIERSANHEAMAQLGRALERLQSLPASPDRDRLELTLRMPLGAAEIGVLGHAGTQVADTFRRARELSESLGDVQRLFGSNWNLWISRHISHHLAEARQLSGELLRIARGTGEEEHLLQANHAGWTTALALGAYKTAKGHVDEGLPLYDLERHRSHALRFGGHDPGVCGHGFGSLAYWALGLADQAAARARRAIELADRRGHPSSAGQGRSGCALVFAVRGEIAQAREHASRCVALLAEYRLSNLTGWASTGVLLHCWTEALLGDRDAGYERMKRELAHFRVSGVQLFRTIFLCLFADYCGATGRVGEGLEAVAEGLGLAGESGERMWLAELHRVRADLLLRQSAANRDEAERELRAALDVARGQHARMFELRAATALATLLGESRRRGEALELLRPAYAAIPEGHDTADLVAARKTLDALS
jgi:class 3 adenylate cyclase/predicted ATPase